MNTLKTVLAATAALWALPALAADTITVSDAYARFMPGAMSGVAFMSIENTGDEDDRLTGVAADIAAKAELHSHKTAPDGMMQMLHVQEGFAIPANGRLVLERGGDHVMVMGLTERPAEGGTVHLVLTFEKAGTVELDVPVDNAR